MIEEYYYKMMNRDEILLVQRLLFLKGYKWVVSGKSFILTDSDGPHWISINVLEKEIYTTANFSFRSMDFNELLDLIESDKI